MISPDYILRLVRQLAQVTAVLVGLKRSGRYAEAEATLDQAGRRLLGLSASLIGALSSEGLLQLLRAGDRLDRGKCLALAEYLREAADLAALQGQAEAATAAQIKALDLLLETVIEPSDPAWREWLPIIAELRQALGPAVLPSATQQRLTRFEQTLARTPE